MRVKHSAYQHKEKHSHMEIEPQLIRGIMEDCCVLIVNFGQKLSLRTIIQYG